MATRPFDMFPGGGTQLLGRPRAGNGTCRTGYGLSLQRMTGQTSCAYCGVDLVGDYYRWLLMAVDHVVPAGEARRLGIPPQFYEDAINLALTCSGCNGYLNRYRLEGEPGMEWSVDQFVALRNQIFDHRYELIEARREKELAIFAQQPWARR